MSESKTLEISPSISIIVAGVIIAAAIIYTRTLPPAQPLQAAEAGAPTTSVSVRAPSATDHIAGSPTAPIVLIEYSDFQCPYCSLVYPTLKRLVAESNGTVAWVYRQFPLESIHPNARPAAMASECVAEQLGNDGFWKFADTLFANQSKLGNAYYEQVAVGLGVNKTKFDSCISSNTYAGRIDADSAEAQQNGGQGTPYTVVYGKGKQLPVSGALPYEQFKSVIDSIK